MLKYKKLLPALYSVAIFLVLLLLMQFVPAPILSNFPKKILFLSIFAPLSLRLLYHLRAAVNSPGVKMEDGLVLENAKEKQLSSYVTINISEVKVEGGIELKKENVGEKQPSSYPEVMMLTGGFFLIIPVYILFVIRDNGFGALYALTLGIPALIMFLVGLVVYILRLPNKDSKGATGRLIEEVPLSRSAEMPHEVIVQSAFQLVSRIVIYFFVLLAVAFGLLYLIPLLSVKLIIWSIACASISFAIYTYYRKHVLSSMDMARQSSAAFDRRPLLLGMFERTEVMRDTLSARMSSIPQKKEVIFVSSLILLSLAIIIFDIFF